MRGRFLVVVLVVGVAACGIGRQGTVQVAGTPGATIPSTVADHLDDQWRGWQIVPLPSGAAVCASRFDRPPSAIAEGDWNGDGAPDLAFEISGPAGRHLVAALGRLGGEYDVVEVASVADAGGVLGVKQRGGRFRLKPGGFDFYYNADTIAFAACSQPETVYVWTATKFERWQVFD